jgi:HEAT repeat protein
VDLKVALQRAGDSEREAWTAIRDRLAEHAKAVEGLVSYVRNLAALHDGSSFQPTAETWLGLAESEDAGLRLSALLALEGMPDDRIPPLVERSLSDREAVIRAQAAKMAGGLGLAGCLGRLLRLLEDESDHVRSVADFAIEEIAGGDFGFEATDPEEKRREAIDRIAKWLEEREE